MKDAGNPTASEYGWIASRGVNDNDVERGFWQQRRFEQRVIANGPDIVDRGSCQVLR